MRTQSELGLRIHASLVVPLNLGRPGAGSTGAYFSVVIPAPDKSLNRRTMQRGRDLHRNSWRTNGSRTQDSQAARA